MKGDSFVLLRSHDLSMSNFIADYLGELRLEGRSERTIRDTGRCLRRLHEDLPHGIAYACREQLQAWIAYDEWSPATRRTYESLIRPFFAWLEAHGYLPLGNPTAGMRRQRCPTPKARVVPDGVEAVAFASSEPLLTAVLFARYQGLRRAECAGLERDDVTEEETYIRNAKGGNPQTVPTHPVVWDHVRGRPTGRLVVDQDGQPLNPEQLGALAGRHFRRHGLPGVGLHDLRRLFALEVYDLDHDPMVTKESLRHARIDTTMVYIGIQRRRVRDAIRRVRAVHRAAGPRPVPPAETA